MIRKKLPTIIGAFLTAIACVLVGALPASAHVSIDSAKPNGDGTTTVTFTFNHACAHSPTSSLETTLPNGATLNDVTPPKGWSSKINENTVSMTGPDIPGDRTVYFSLNVTLVGSVGEALLFPTIQTCADGDGYKWVDPAEESNEPAPRLIATTAVLGSVAAPASSPQQSSQGASAVEVAIAIAVFAGLAAGGALAVRRRDHGAGSR